VNLSQLQSGLADTLTSANSYTDSKFATVSSKLGNLDTRINRVGAMSAAMSQMAAAASNIGKDNRIAVGIGMFGGSSGVAIGYQRSVSDNVNFTIGGAVSQGEATAGAGLGFGW
jgi:autotransporter adhesin